MLADFGGRFVEGDRSKRSVVPTWRVNQPDERSPSAASIQRTLHSQTVSVEHMSINHRRFHTVVPQKALHGANFVTNFLCAVGVMA